MTEGKQIYSTFQISYETEDGRKSLYVDVGDLSQWMARQAKVGMFAPHSGVVLLDEGYAGMDARTSSSIANRLLSHFVFQSRKLGLDLYVSVQLASSLEKRVRNLSDAWVLAELQPRENLGKNGNVLSSVDDFRYTYAGVDGSFGEFVLAHEDAEKIFPYYNTMEIVQPPMIALDKKAALEAKKAIQQIGLAARKAQPSQIQAPPPIQEQQTRVQATLTNGMMVKSLVVRQPWASMIASGEKTIETRTWQTKYRGPLLIVASKNPKVEDLPTGQAVALSELVDCHEMTETDEKAACCELYDNAWAWVLKNVRAITPFPVTGQLGLFDVPLPEQAQLVDAPHAKPKIRRRIR